MKDRILAFSEWLRENYLVLIYAAGFVIVMVLLAWSISILYGYWSNGLWGTKFDLTAGLTGVTVLAGGAVTIFGLAMTSNGKYKTDSQFNSPVEQRITNAFKRGV